MTDDKIAEIRDRHSKRTGIDHNGSYRLYGYSYPGTLTQSQRDLETALAEVERLRADNERLFNEDTKTRHALGGWVWVCPDGGDEPTHERVAAVVAEVERLRADRRERIATAVMAGLAACPNTRSSAEGVARSGLEGADALIALLDQEGKP